MTNIKIEKGIPIPGKTPGLSGTLRQMEVGDSIFLPAEFKPKVYGHFTNLRAQSVAHKFATRSVEEGGVKGLRVWRVA